MMDQREFFYCIAFHLLPEHSIILIPLIFILNKRNSIFFILSKWNK